MRRPDIRPKSGNTALFTPGGRLEHDENTLRAFEASYRAGYRGFETDVRMTRDGALVITHDSSLERTTDGKGVVEQHTRAEIEQLHTRQGNKVLFLDELLRFLHDKPGLYVEFEMKTAPQHLYPSRRLEEYCDKLYEAVMAEKPADALYVFTSSDYRALRYLQSRYPGVELLLITSKPCNDETIDLCKTVGIKRLGATMDGTSRASVRRAHDEGIIVSLWPGSRYRTLCSGRTWDVTICAPISRLSSKVGCRKRPLDKSEILAGPLVGKYFEINFDKNFENIKC